MRHQWARSISFLVGVLTLLSACAPQSSGTGPTSGAPAQPVAKKVITIADTYEPKFVVENYTTGGPPLSANNIRFIIHDDLTRSRGYQNEDPALATELPSVEKGTWKINPDGSMQTIWKLRPNVKWHDGQPFTANDLVFTFQTRRDKDVAGAQVSAFDRLIDSVAAPDPLTFTVQWNSPYVDANTVTAGQIAPKHLLDEVYQKEKMNLQTTPLMNTEFVGLGPYKLVSWERGSHLQADRFDDYYLGRPKLDTIYVRFVGNSNAQVTGVLSGAADVAVSTSGQGISLDQANEVRKRWEGTTNKVVNVYTGSFLYGEYQLDPLYTKPLDTQTNQTVRIALQHAIDRPTIADIMTTGLSPAAEGYYPPNEPRLAQLEPSLVKYPYDPTRASQLLSQAGWNKGADGTLVRQSDGQRFDIEVWGRPGPVEKVPSIVADYWKRIGINATPVIQSDAQRGDREVERKRPGYLCCPQAGLSAIFTGHSHKRQIPAAATNWAGVNYGSYSNDKADALVDQLATTLDPRARLPLEQLLLHEYTQDVFLVPVYWQILPQLVLTGIRGPSADYGNVNTNIFDWDRD